MTEILKLKPGVVMEIIHPDSNDDNKTWRIRTADEHGKTVNITLRARSCGPKNPESDLQIMIQIERECGKRWRSETAYLDLPTAMADKFLESFHLRGQ